MSDSDADLMAQVQRDVKTAFPALVRRFERPMMAFLTKLSGSAEIAEDLFQETFLRVFRHREKYRHPAPVRPWILTIARNVWYSRAGKDQREADKRSGAPNRDSKTPEDSLERRETRMQLETALQTLPPRMREAVVLRFDQELPYTEIAEIMGVTPGTVGGWLSEGVDRLARALKGKVE